MRISSTGGVIRNSHILDNLVGEGFQGSFNGACKSGPRGGDSVDGAGGPRGSVQVLEGEGKTIGSGWGERRERNFLLVVPLGSSLGEHSGQRIVALQAHTTRAVRSVVAGVATATLDLISIPSIATRQFREVFTGSVSGAVFRAGGAGASDTSVSVEAIALSCFAVARSLVRALAVFMSAGASPRDTEGARALGAITSLPVGVA